MAPDKDKIDITVPVYKFSHALGVNADRSVPWTQLVAENIFLVITGHRSKTLLHLRVVHGTTCIVSSAYLYLQRCAD